jgi:hypothetical protein
VKLSLLAWPDFACFHPAQKLIAVIAEAPRRKPDVGRPRILPSQIRKSLRPQTQVAGGFISIKKFPFYVVNLHFVHDAPPAVWFF